MSFVKKAVTAWFLFNSLFALKSSAQLPNQPKQIQNPDNQTNNLENRISNECKNIINSALKSDGYIFLNKSANFERYDAASNTYSTEGHLDVTATYNCGKYGGSGSLDFRFYLGDNELYDFNSGINSIYFMLFSRKKTRIEKKVLEVNLNSYADIATFAPVEYRLIETEKLGGKVGDLFMSLLKILKIDKQDVKEVLSDIKALGDIAYNQDFQYYIYKANLMLGSEAYCEIIDYSGSYPVWGDVNLPSAANNNLKVPRAVKIVKVSIDEGEEAIDAIGLILTKNKYK